MKNENTDIVEKKPTTLKELVSNREIEFRKLLPKDTVKYERVIKSFWLELETSKNNDKLKACSAVSLIASLNMAVNDGLAFGTNRCYLIPYKNKQADGKWILEAQYQRSYLGIIDLIRRAGSIKKIGAGVVYSNEEFSIIRGSEDKLIHIPTRREEERGKLEGAYMYARTPNDELVTEWMTVKELEKIRSLSKVPDSPAWKNHLTEMYKKIVLKRGIKLLPISPDLLASLQEEDDEQYELEKPNKVKSSLNSVLSPTPVEVESVEQEDYETQSLEPEEIENQEAA